MSTSRVIIDALANAAAAEETVVLATVVKISGSSYGGVGTRMVVRADGSTIGLVSGGCLESDLAEHAREVRSTGVAKVVTYDTRGDDDAVWGLGLGCNGLFDVLLEPLDPTQARRIADMLSRAQAARSPRIMATVIRADDRASVRLGAHALFLSDRIIMTGGDWSMALIDPVSAATMDALKAGRRGLVREIEGLEIAIEVLTPPVRLLICGSGPDVVPFVRLATGLGWDVTILDHREITSAAAERFPGATVIQCIVPSEVIHTMELTEQTATVIMSHNFDRDTAYVEALIQSGAGYIGILGPRARTERMFAALRARGINVSDARIFAPVGLDVGGDGPSAIALAIISEISAVLTGHNGGHLRDKRGPLH